MKMTTSDNLGFYKATNNFTSCMYVTTNVIDGPVTTINAPTHSVHWPGDAGCLAGEGLTPEAWAARALSQENSPHSSESTLRNIPRSENSLQKSGHNG